MAAQSTSEQPAKRKRNPPPAPTEFASDTQLAQRYSVSRATIWRWSQEGKIPPPLRITGNCTRWRLSEVIEAVEGAA
ncbi:helix-turn-helix transcriptional regulator [Kineobactrum salinum]|uniref:AlpA family phage regulatory protein n=1 Tax=Kineobactrum salinum TaxID=2708301 RepID=A0A6C0U6K7_9GAMM|nr:AlpA family phage regulatory protein [Kineobactrum salinum]